MMTEFPVTSNNFAFNIYQTLVNDNNENVFLSPQSVSMTMAMVLLGADDNTAVELKRGLGYEGMSTSTLHQNNHEILKKMSNMKSSVLLEIANKLFPEISYTMKEKFLESCQTFYASEIEGKDFKQEPDQARLEINQWVDDKTHGKIKDLLPAGSVNGLTRLVLANAVYFKGNWMKKFEENQTMETDFHVNESKSVKVNMMSQKEKFNISYDSELKVQVLELPYQGNEISMILLVPSERFGLSKVEEKLTSEKLDSLTSTFSKEEVIIALPRMKLEQQYDLIPTLKKMGIRDVFDESMSKLQSMSDVPNLFVSAVMHKAFIEVNEEGTTAAAATAAGVSFMSLPPQVICDHPFMFLIRHNPSRNVLFVGRLMSP
ncbi:leukocyte elastase inhibitor-like [Clavelina lepadiformis]